MIINSIGKKEIDQEVKELLLSADPNYDKIEKYLNESEIFILQDGKKVIGVLVLKHTHEHITEIMNIAVKEGYQGKGYGKRLLNKSEKVAREIGSKYLEIGTGNSSINQIYMYQKFGFRIYRIIKDFFSDYNKEIYENGIKCRDMIKFRKTLRHL